MSKYRPNYIKARQHIQQAAEALATAGDVLFRAYQKGIPEGHPLLVAMRSLANLDRDTARRVRLEVSVRCLRVWTRRRASWRKSSDSPPTCGTP